MKKIGYLRVSTEDQKPDRQIDGLKNLCDEIHIEKISATAKKRPVFEKVIKKLNAGDSLVVWALDRAFRSTLECLIRGRKASGTRYKFSNCNPSNGYDNAVWRTVLYRSSCVCAVRA